MRWTFLIALALAAPAAANASGAVDAMPMTADDAVAYNYWPTADRPTAKELVARLDRLCASKRQRDQRRCEESWRVINAAYADLQAKKAAQAE
jgi:hypothetical protein